MSTKLITQDEVQVRKEYLEVQLEILHKILKEKLEEHEKLQKLETKLGKKKDPNNKKTNQKGSPTTIPNETKIPETIHPKTNRSESNQRASVKPPVVRNTPVKTESEKKKPKGSHADEGVKQAHLPHSTSQHKKKSPDAGKDRDNFTNLLVQKLHKEADKDKKDVKEKRKEKENHKEHYRGRERERERERAKSKDKPKTLVLHSKAGASNYKMLVSGKALNEESSERNTSDNEVIPQYRNREKSTRKSKVDRDYGKDMKPKKKEHKGKRENDSLANMLPKEPSRHRDGSPYAVKHPSAKHEKYSKREVKESVHCYEDPKQTLERELNRDGADKKEGFDKNINYAEWQQHIDDLKENKKRLEKTYKEHKNDPNFTYLSGVIKGFTKNIRDRTKELKHLKANDTKIE